jgi:CheY-like chemotaxis protein
MKQINPCNFPTRVFLIDDSSQALEKLERVLDDAHATYHSFNKPQEAVNFINALPALPDQWKTPMEEGLLDVEISNLYQEIYNPKRFNQVSTIVVDYDMPALNGLELCEQINSSHIQKVLLTGAADEELAVQAFNRGLIQHFIRKQDPQALDLLDQYISESQQRYFKTLTQGLVRQIDADSTAIADPVFIDLFKKITQEHDICEYYLLEGTGSFLMLDAQGHPSALFTFTEELLGQNDEMIDELLQDGSDLLPEGLADDLLEHRKALCFHYFEGLSFPTPNLWHQYAQDIHLIEGKQPYYWAYVPDLKDLSRKNLTSFNQYKSV